MRAAMINARSTRKDKTMATDTKEKTLGSQLKFKLEFMFLMLSAGRREEAAKAYDDLIAAFDKLA
jgi:hypothetical protein